MRYAVRPHAVCKHTLRCSPDPESIPELTSQEHPSVPVVVQMVQSICRWYPFHKLRGKDPGAVGE
jgi:hypothetical protein